jgi:hypothetical protein
MTHVGIDDVVIVPVTAKHVNAPEIARVKTLMPIKVSSPSELMAEDHALSELSSLTMHRRTRLLQSNYQLPGIFWCVLLTGGVLTLLSVSMFGSAKPRVHTLQVFSLTPSSNARHVGHCRCRSTISRLGSHQ